MKHNINWAMDINPTPQRPTMKIQGLSKRQRQIADLLWVAQTQDELRLIFRLYGDEARVVQDMMIAQGLDEVLDVDLANSVLDRFRLDPV
jgi:hypothetical protein